jgi:hypothetical protein
LLDFYGYFLGWIFGAGMEEIEKELGICFIEMGF